MNTRGDVTRQTIMAYSRTLFASRGVDAVSIRDIGATVGLTNPALFRHFPSKEALAVDLFTASYRRLVTALRQAREADGFEAWLAAALAEVASEPDGVLYVMDNLRRYFSTLPADLQHDNLPRLVGAMIAREQAAERFRRDLDARLAVTLILGALGQTARSILFHDATIEVRDHSHRLARLFAHGLATSENHK